MTLTKPPPPPPKFVRGQLPSIEAKQFARPVKQLDHYQLPMASDYVPAWVKVLRDCGYPTDVVVIDFETYFDDEYRMAGSGDGLTTIEYVTDERFEILGVSVTQMNGQYPFADYEAATHFWYGEQTERQIRYLQETYGEHLERATVVFQNAPFDALILAIHFGIYPKQVVDVLALARHWSSRQKHGLDTLTKQFDLPAKGDTEEFKGLTFRRRFAKPKGRKKGPKLPVQVPIITPEQIERLAGYACNDGMREWELFTILLPKLSNPKTELRLIQHTLELWTKPVLKVDFEKGKELVAQFTAEMDKAVAATGHTAEEISKNKSFETFLTDRLKAIGDDPAKYYKQCKITKANPIGMMLALAKDDDQLDTLKSHPDETVRNLIAARVGIKSWPLHIARVERIMRMAACRNGWLGVPLKYCGAHTGRWSGGEKINLQNLAKYGLLAAIRHLLIAPTGIPGYADMILVIVDASQIEARVLAWIAGEWVLVEKFANGEEIYCGFASKVLGVPIRKAKKTDLPAIAKRLTWARNSIGKIGVLGCGYGMGTDRIFEMAEGQITLETAEKIKLTYRAENPAIVQFWKDIEKAFIYTAKYKRSCSMPRGLRFDSAPDCDVVITLPNGRELKYHKVKLVADDYGDKIEVWNGIEHRWEHVWGGHLTENIVQAMSRDVLAEAFLRLEDLGYRTGLHVHDEVVSCVPVDQGESVLAASIREMSRVPDWGPGMPLGAEGGLSDRYRK